MDALQDALAGDPGARTYLLAALRMAGRTFLPTDPDVALDFARVHLSALLLEEFGAQRAEVFLEDVARRIHAASRRESTSRRATAAEPPTSSARVPRRRAARTAVLLLHGDGFERAALARQLVAGGFDVEVVETLDDLNHQASEPTLAVVDLTMKEASQWLMALVPRSELRVVALGAVDVAARAVLARLREPISLPRGVGASELVAVLRQLAIGSF